jgi:hypothetical protein
VPDPEGPHVDRESRTVGFGPEILTDYSNYLDKAAKIVGVGDDVDAVAACESKVREELGRTRMLASDQLGPLARRACEMIRRATRAVQPV